MSKPAPLIQLRKPQNEAFWREVRRLFLLWRRQFGKSYTLSSKALYRMMDRRDHLCVFCSASIPLGKEFIRKEAQVYSQVLDKFREAAKLNNYLATSNADGLDVDAIADLFEHEKLETKLWHDRTTHSRSVVVAPNPTTAVGWTGDVFMDEVGRIPNLKEVMEAVGPIMSSNPDFIWWLSSTPPPDDKHYSFELFAPDTDEFPVNPLGNFYESKSGILVHRVDAYDSVTAGIPLYDDNTGEVVTPEQHRAMAFDKTAWDRNYGLRFIVGGSAALSTASIARAMIMGKRQGVAVNVTEAIEL
jgi:hypothetical protein